MVKLTDEQREILIILRDKLDNKCDKGCAVCPKEIGLYDFRCVSWLCGECKYFFHWINNVNKLSIDRVICPCYLVRDGFINPDELFLHLDELIEDV